MLQISTIERAPMPFYCGEGRRSHRYENGRQPVVQATKVTNSERAMHARVLKGGRLPFKRGVAVPRSHAGDLEMT
jgi:hypothetical protein